MTTLLGIPISPFSKKVIITLDLKGVDYTVEPVTPMNKPDGFDLISPLGKIPAFKDDQIALSDSTVICEYLDERYPSPKIYPENLVDKAKARWLEEYADTHLLTVCGVQLFFERIIKPAFLQQPTDETIVQENLAQAMPKALAYLESQIKGREFLVGNALSIADIAVGSQFLNARYADFTPDAQQYPEFSAYLDRLLNHELFIKRITQDKEMMGHS